VSRIVFLSVELLRPALRLSRHNTLRNHITTDRHERFSVFGPESRGVSLPRRARPVGVIRAAAGASGHRPRTRDDLATDGGLPGGTALAEPVTGRQPQARARQVVRADRAAPSAPPRRPLTRPGRRPLRGIRRRGIIGAVRGGLRGHGDDLLPVTSSARDRGERRARAPPWNSSSTSARRYRGRPTSSRTSGSRPRLAHVATAAEVTRNTAATCLRVIRSSSTGLPVMAAAAHPRPGRTRHTCSPAVPVPTPSHSSESPGEPELADRGQRRSPLDGCSPGHGPGTIPQARRRLHRQCCCKLQRKTSVS